MKIDDIRNELISIAKEEFQTMGYSSASMRTIAKRAHLTTGAMYNRFQDKEGLLSAIVGDCATSLKNYFDSLKDIGEPFDAKELLDILFESKENFKILFCKSSGSSFENYRVELTTLISKKLKSVLNEKKEGKVSENLIYILVSSFVMGIEEIVSQDAEKEEAYTNLKSLIAFFHSGWEAIR